MARGPEAAGAVGLDGPPGRFGVLDVEGRAEPLPFLRMADMMIPVAMWLRGKSLACPASRPLVQVEALKRKCTS